MKFLTCLCLCLSPFFLTAADLPPPVLPDGVGVNIHFTKGHERDLDLIAAAGFRFIRMDFGWESTERQKGKYDWSAYDALTADLEQRPHFFMTTIPTGSARSGSIWRKRPKPLGRWKYLRR